MSENTTIEQASTAILKAAKLEGPALDHWVAVAKGWHRRPGKEGGVWEGVDVWASPDNTVAYAPANAFEPSRDMRLASDLVEEEQLSVTSPKSPIHVSGGPLAGWRERGTWGACSWHAGVDGKRAFGRDETAAAAAICRCYVALKLGREFDPRKFNVEGARV